MRHLFARRQILLVILLANASPAFATEPCMNMKEDQFIEEVLTPSTSVVFAKVTAFSPTDPLSGSNRQWTKVEVIETLFPEGSLDKKTIPIEGWQAVDIPRSDHPVGSHVVLFLKESGGKYRLTNDSWQWCVPALWNAKPDRTACRNYDSVTDSSAQWISTKSIRTFVDNRRK